MSDMMKKDEEVEFDQDIFDSMINGSFEPDEEVEDDGVENEAEETAELDDDEYQEDTDLEEDSEADEELDEAGDGELDEDSDDEDDFEEEDSLVEDDDLDDEDSDDVEEDEDADEADESDEDGTDDESEDDTDTEDPSDGEGSDTAEVDYKAFYDAVVNTEFVVNGRKTKGFADPQKIIQSQQMAGGFSEKMAGFKQYRPFMSPLKERGMLDDQAKFDLAMNLVDGDKEAIKAHLQSLNIDPLDLDMEKIDYSGKSNVASNESIAIEDAMERAKASGIEDKVRQVVGSEWDAESFQEFATNDAVRNDLLSHIESGAYEMVQDKILEMKRLDFNGAFSGKKTVDQYRAAVRELQASQPAPVTTQAPEPQSVKRTAPKASVKAEKAKIEKARKEQEYKDKAATREAKLTQQRKRATSVSKKKPKAKPKAQFDPMRVEGAELDDLMDFLATGGRG